MPYGNRVMIVGGGPIGLLTGILLLKDGYDVYLFEEDRDIGYPQHCTGIVSGEALDLYPISRNKLIVNKYYGVYVKVGRVDADIYRSTVPKAYVINRVLLERELAKKFVDNGGRLTLNRRVNVDVLLNENKFNFIIDAGGAKSLIRKGYKDILPAIQIDIEPEKEVFDRYLAGIFIDKEINSEYFIWVSPRSNGIYRIGSASSKNLKDKLISFIKREGLFGKISGRLGGLIVTGGPIKNFVSGNVLNVGDSAGMVKITTGGGLYYGAVGAHILVKSLVDKEISSYRKRWISRFGKELTFQKVIREFFLNANNDDLRNVFSTLSRKEIFNLLVSVGDMDFHASSLFKIIMEKDMIKYLLNVKILRGLLTRNIMNYFG